MERSKVSELQRERERGECKELSFFFLRIGVVVVVVVRGTRNKVFDLEKAELKKAQFKLAFINEIYFL